MLYSFKISPLVNGPWDMTLSTVVDFVVIEMLL